MTGVEDNWHYQGQDFSAHPSCATPMRQAIKDFRPITRPDVTGTAWAYCSVTEADFAYRWERLPEWMKDERRAEYNEKMERILDFQVAACKAYAAKLGLPEPVVVREIASRTNLLQGLKQIRTKALPGDHILMPTNPRQRGQAKHQDYKAIAFTMAVANKLAKAGITLHCVYNSIDWNNPFGQQFIRMAIQAQKIHVDTRVFMADYEHAEIRSLYGFNWWAIQTNKVFLWTIQCIRDKGMSPVEVAKASRRYWCVLAFSSSEEKTFCVGITRSKPHAESIRAKGWRRCVRCREPVLTDKCPYHYRDRTIPMSFRVAKGLQFIDKEEDFVYTASTLWAWYCQKNPDQDKMPWKDRIHVDSDVS